MSLHLSCCHASRELTRATHFVGMPPELSRQAHNDKYLVLLSWPSSCAAPTLRDPSTMNHPAGASDSIHCLKVVHEALVAPMGFEQSSSRTLLPRTNSISDLRINRVGHKTNYSGHSTTTSLEMSQHTGNPRGSERGRGTPKPSRSGGGSASTGGGGPSAPPRSGGSSATASGSGTSLLTSGSAQTIDEQLSELNRLTVASGEKKPHYLDGDVLIDPDAWTIIVIGIHEIYQQVDLTTTMLNPEGRRQRFYPDVLKPYLHETTVHLDNIQKLSTWLYTHMEKENINEILTADVYKKKAFSKRTMHIVNAWIKFIEAHGSSLRTIPEMSMNSAEAVHEMKYKVAGWGEILKPTCQLAPSAIGSEAWIKTVERGSSLPHGLRTLTAGG